jgi:hypothetical protein
MGTNCAECGKAMTKPQYEKCYNCMTGMKAEKQYVEKPIGGKGSQVAIYEPVEVRRPVVKQPIAQFDLTEMSIEDLLWIEHNAHEMIRIKLNQKYSVPMGG